MQTLAVNLHAQYFLEAHIGYGHFGSEVAKQRKLTGLVGRFEHERFEVKRADETFGRLDIHVAGFIENTDTSRAFTRLDDEVHSSRIEPRLALLDQRADRILAERAVVLLAQFELQLETERARAACHFRRSKRH